MFADRSKKTTFAEKSNICYLICFITTSLDANRNDQGVVSNHINSMSSFEKN